MTPTYVGNSHHADVHALAFAPGAWLGWATWMMPVILAGVIVGLLYRVITALTGDANSLEIAAASRARVCSRNSTGPWCSVIR